MNVVYPFISDPVLSARVRWVGEAVAEEPDRSYTGVTRQTHIPTYEQLRVAVRPTFLGGFLVCNQCLCISLTLSGFSSGSSAVDDTSASATLRRESNKGMARSEFTTPERESWSRTSSSISSTDWSCRGRDKMHLIRAGQNVIPRSWRTIQDGRKRTTYLIGELRLGPL